MSVSRARVLLAIPFLVVAVGALAVRRAVPHWGERIGRGASHVVTSLVPPRVSPRVWPRAVRSSGGDSPSAPTGSEPAGDALEDAGDLGDASTPLAAHVPAPTVQWAIDDRGARLHLRTAHDASGRPAGIRLTGVASLDPGTGLRDGDVIVSVEGEPVRNEEAATDLAILAVAQGRSTLHAVAMRRGRPVAITAELPPAPAPPASGQAR